MAPPPLDGRIAGRPSRRRHDGVPAGLIQHAFRGALRRKKAAEKMLHADPDDERHQHDQQDEHHEVEGFGGERHRSRKIREGETFSGA